MEALPRSPVKVATTDYSEQLLLQRNVDEKITQKRKA
jgi:hypothetical protein